MTASSAATRTNPVRDPNPSFQDGLALLQLEQKTRVAPLPLSPGESERIANLYGTPVYIIDEETLKKKRRELAAAFSAFAGPVHLAYSMKANFNPALTSVLMDEGVLFDITSIGELRFYLRRHGRPENIIYTSVTEERSEFVDVLKTGVERVVVSSYNGLANLVEAARDVGGRTGVLIRVNPEVGVKAEVRASYRNGKFGVPFNTSSQDSAMRLLLRIMSEPDLDFEGFHFHLGSQIEDPKCFVTALDKLENFIQKASKEFPGLRIKIIDIGGGTPVTYGSQVPSPEEIGRIVVERLNTMQARLKMNFSLIVESGRFLSAEATSLLSRIVNSKVFGDQRFLIVDAGYHLLLDSALLRQEYPQQVIPEIQAESILKTSVAGRLCDTYDIFRPSSASNLAGAEVGKLLVFRNVGAYSVVFNMPFHCQTKPAILMKKTSGELIVVRRGETIEELFEEEGGNLPSPIDGRG